MDKPIPTQLLQPADLGALYDCFERALDVPEESRSAWLDSEVADPVLRAELIRLLRSDSASGALDTPAQLRAERIQGDGLLPFAGMQGRRIGQFQLTRLLGSGGMATVFLGERVEADFQQRVAVKLLRRGLYSSSEMRWFRRERRALASLSHPNIARLLDGGLTSDGIPYLVLEYVDGVPIDEHCGAARLDVRARLQLMVDVCRAVAAAHRALIVHRDIKPSNVMVDRSGQVKLLDFGIAKLLDEGEVQATRTAHRALTPGYAAPEQYGDAPVTTATDVYALGVTLHELLLGVRPELRQARPSQFAATLDVVPFGTPTALSAMLRGDLDNILAKALALDPADRYASAAELGDDIDAYLAARPVRAHPPSRIYTLRKFVQRHRGGVLVTTLLLVGMLASLFAALWQAQIAREQARRASEAQAFLESLFEPFSERTPKARTPSLQELLQRGVERSQEAALDDPALRADLLAMFARVHDKLGLSEVALSEQAWQANVAAWGADDERSLQVRKSYARALERHGNYERAQAEYEALLAQHERLGTRGDVHASVIDDYTTLRMQRGISGSEAVALREKSLQLRLAVPDISPKALSQGYNNLATSLQYAAEFDRSLPLLHKALEINLQSGHRYGVAMNQLNIGLAEGYRGRWREAAGFFAQSRASFNDIHVEGHPALALAVIEQCRLAGELEDWASLDEFCDEAVRLARAAHGEDHHRYGSALNRRAAAALAAGRLEQAERDFAAAREVILRSEGDQADALERVDGAQVRLWMERAEYARARDVLLGLLDPGRKRRAPSIGELLQRAQLLLACEHAPAPACADHPLARIEELIAAPAYRQHAARLWVSSLVAEVELRRGQSTQASRRLRDALERFAPALGPQHSRIAQARLLLAQALDAAGDKQGANSERALARPLIEALPASHRLRTP